MPDRSKAPEPLKVATSEVERAHIVGHSSGGVIALQLACEKPDLLESLVLIEPPLLSVPSAETLVEALEPITSRYFGGDAAGAVDGFMRLLGGPEWRNVSAAAIPGGPEQAERDAATFFELELPGVGAWQCEVEKIRAFPRPVLFMWGDKSLHAIFTLIAAASAAPRSTAQEMPELDLSYAAGETEMMTVGYLDKGEGPAVVFFHPGVDARYWQWAIEAVSSSFRVIALPFDQSTPPAFAFVTDALNLTAILEGIINGLDVERLILWLTQWAAAKLSS